ncbi:MAG: hypothetical protein KC636_23775 [Myxococcales bacterium]|nr:hypothetical protein [Myxococcales bacterium]
MLVLDALVRVREHVLDELVLDAPVLVLAFNELVLALELDAHLIGAPLELTYSPANAC